jgi:carbamoyl-phosphate synthase large subunit
LAGTELTVDFFCNREGKLISAVPGERLSALSKAFSKDGGAIDQGRTFHDPNIFQMVKQLTENIKFWGAANFQGYRDQQGKIKIVEINPRFSGATVMTKGAGHDFFQWSIDLASGKEILVPEKDFEDICMSSWLSPIFFKEVKILPPP